MTRPGWRGVSLREEMVDKVEHARERKYTNPRTRPALGAFVEELLYDVIEGDEELRRYGPLLEELAVDDNRILIKDNRRNEIAELTFRDKVLFCSLDDSDNCVHIGFAWAIPKVYKVMNARGERKPASRR
jgi:hypothetical protein